MNDVEESKGTRNQGENIVLERGRLKIERIHEFVRCRYCEIIRDLCRKEN